MLAVMAEAGSRPGGRGTFLCFAKEKYPKERRPPVCDPFAVRSGKPASCRLRGAPWNLLCAARAARTSTASQFTRHGRCDAHAHPTTAPPQAQPAGVGAEHPNSRTSIRAIAALGPVCAARGACARETGPSAAQRSNGPCGCPFWVPFCACREAQGRGCVRVPKDTRTSCTDLPQLFERSA